MRMKSKWFFLFVVYPLIIGALALAPSGSVSAADTVKIGVMTPLSPPGATLLGKFILQGAEMGAEYVNSHEGVLGGKKIELVVEDNLVARAVEAIKTAAHSGRIGDGKIFILPVDDSLRIRTGETGADAL